MTVLHIGGNQGRGDPARVARARHHASEPLADEGALRAVLWLAVGFALALTFAPALVALYVRACL